MRRVINTNTHKTKPINYNKLKVINYHLELGETIVVYCNQLVHKQCGCIYHTNAIRTELHMTLIQWCTTTCFNLWQDNRRIFAIQFESHKHLISI